MKFDKWKNRFAIWRRMYKSTDCNRNLPSWKQMERLYLQHDRCEQEEKEARKVSDDYRELYGTSAWNADHAQELMCMHEQAAHRQAMIDHKIERDFSRKRSK